jgi:hypothetical protein
MDPAKKKKLLILLVILLLILAGVLAWLFFFNKQPPTTLVQNEKPASSSAKTATSSSSSSSSVAPAEDDLTLIKKALIAKTQIAADQINVTISQNDGKYAKGFVGTKGEDTGGGYFLAVKVNGAWIIVYDGQANPDCAPINAYAFPVAMVPECLDANGNLMKR